MNRCIHKETYTVGADTYCVECGEEKDEWVMGGNKMSKEKKTKKIIKKQRITPKSVLALSGGLDSTTLLHYVASKTKGTIYPISFMYGQKHKKELEFAKEQVKLLQKKGFKVKDLKLININVLKDLTKGASALTDSKIKVPKMSDVVGQEQPITYVPFRNQILLSLALSYAESVGAKTIYYGAQARDLYGYWDCTINFVKAINNVAKLNRKNQIQIVAPFVNLTKGEEVVVGKKLGVDYSKTLTCYSGRNCGRCPTCVERIMAFAQNGLKDPIQYQSYVNWEGEIKKHKVKMKVSDVMKRIVE